MPRHSKASRWLPGSASPTCSIPTRVLLPQHVDACTRPPNHLLDTAPSPIQFPQTWHMEQGTPNCLFCLGNPSQPPGQVPLEGCEGSQSAAVENSASSSCRVQGPRFPLKAGGPIILPAVPREELGPQDTLARATSPEAREQALLRSSHLGRMSRQSPCSATVWIWLND